MIDENAFGILVSFHAIEDEEYESDELDEFVDRFTLFQRLVLQCLQEGAPGEGVKVLCFGHAVYLELAEDAAAKGLLGWAKGVRKELSEHDFDSAVILTHGGRWMTDEPSAERVSHVGSSTVLHCSLPSEPLQRALVAHTASHGLPAEADAWGPGLYLDTDALDALGIRPKNEPTRLEVAGAAFYRVG